MTEAKKGEERQEKQGKNHKREIKWGEKRRREKQGSTGGDREEEERRRGNKEIYFIPISISLATFACLNQGEGRDRTEKRGDIQMINNE